MINPFETIVLGAVVAAASAGLGTYQWFVAGVFDLPAFACMLLGGALAALTLAAVVPLRMGGSTKTETGGEARSTPPEASSE